MGRRKSNAQLEIEKLEQIERGKRIKDIRDIELRMNKSELARIIGISSQFLGLVEDGKGNLVYDSIRKLRDISGHSADYILYGVDDESINNTRKLLENYSDDEIVEALNIIEKLSLFIKKS